MSPYSGEMTEFGAVDYKTLETFHGVIWDAEPSKDNPAIPVIVNGRGHNVFAVMGDFRDWIKKVSKGSRPIFVSDNPAYDFQWINYYFDMTLGENPFGHSGRRISDFWAGIQRDFSKGQGWKSFRVTPHDHNPVNDAMGNVEAFKTIMKILQDEES